MHTYDDERFALNEYFRDIRVLVFAFQVSGVQNTYETRHPSVATQLSIAGISPPTHRVTDRSHGLQAKYFQLKVSNGDNDSVYL